MSKSKSMSLSIDKNDSREERKIEERELKSFLNQAKDTYTGVDVSLKPFHLRALVWYVM